VQTVELNWYEASFACSGRGMRLFQISSREVTELLSLGAEKVFRRGSGSTLWVDGLNPHCQIADNKEGSFKVSRFTCRYKMWSFCEELENQSSDTPEIGNPHLENGCYSCFNYSRDGVVISTVLTHQTPLVYEKAVVACRSRGLRLFQMSSPEAATALAVGAIKLFGLSSGARFWVDGLTTSNCQSVLNSDEDYQAVSSPCDSRMWSFCEDVKVQQGMS
jgi:hypothetical protein